MENLKPIMKHLRLKLWNILLKNWPEFFKNVGAVKDQKKKKKKAEILPLPTLTSYPSFPLDPVGTLMAKLHHSVRFPKKKCDHLPDYLNEPLFLLQLPSLQQALATLKSASRARLSFFPAGLHPGFSGKGCT